jgi:dsRNA-specific ribonuclease
MDFDKLLEGTSISNDPQTNLELVSSSVLSGPSVSSVLSGPSVPSVLPIQAPSNIMNEDEFRNKVVDNIIFSKDLTKTFLPDFAEEITRVNGDFFALCFIHPSYDWKNNYESLEKVGDSYLKCCMIKYLYKIDIEKDLGLNDDGINNYISKYADKSRLASVGQYYHLDKYVIKIGNVETTSLYEDLVEAFLGAMASECDKIGIGLGFIAVYNFVVNMIENIFKLKFTKEEFEESRPAGTWFKEIYDIIDKDKSNELFDVRDEKSTQPVYEFWLRGSLLDTINDNNQRLQKAAVLEPKLLAQTIYKGQKQKITRRLAENNLASYAKKILIKSGFDNKYILFLRLMKNIQLSGLNETDQTKLLKKMNSDGYLCYNISVNESISNFTQFTMVLFFTIKKDTGIREFEDIWKKSIVKEGSFKDKELKHECEKLLLMNYINDN